MRPFDSREFEDCLCRLWDVPDASWARYRAAKDPLRKKITAADAARFDAAALARAELAFGRFAGPAGPDAPGRWAAALGIDVADEPSRSGEAPPFLSLATRKPARICLSAGALARIARVVGVYGLADRAGDEALWRGMLTGHELYHHLEWSEPEAFGAEEKVELWRFGGFSRRSTPICVSEMAAMHFARLAVGGGFQPDIVELLFLVDGSPGAAMEWFRFVLG